MFYRRKILLSILHTFGERLTRTQVQKLTFIFTRWQESPAFDFVPYRFGCFSFQANQDLVTMKKAGLLEEYSLDGFQYWQKADKTDFALQLKKGDRGTVGAERVSIQEKRLFTPKASCSTPANRWGLPSGTSRNWASKAISAGS